MDTRHIHIMFSGSASAAVYADLDAQVRSYVEGAVGVGLSAEEIEEDLLEWGPFTGVRLRQSVALVVLLDLAHFGS